MKVYGIVINSKFIDIICLLMDYLLLIFFLILNYLLCSVEIDSVFFVEM